MMRQSDRPSSHYRSSRGSQHSCPTCGAECSFESQGFEEGGEYSEREQPRDEYGQFARRERGHRGYRGSQGSREFGRYGQGGQGERESWRSGEGYRSSGRYGSEMGRSSQYGTEYEPYEEGSMEDYSSRSYRGEYGGGYGGSMGGGYSSQAGSYREGLGRDEGYSGQFGSGGSYSGGRSEGAFGTYEGQRGMGWNGGRGRESFGGGQRSQGRFSSQGRQRNRGPKGYTRSDERIKEDLSDRLMEGYLDASEVEIDVSSGVVTLKGTVDSRDSKYQIEELAENIGGVKDVNNEIKIKRESDREAGDGSGGQTSGGTSSQRGSTGSRKSSMSYSS
ncbi:MAG TPA: BON domain-containing protein [Phycisphaerae bacterium]|nr:BON domain-containing protein [Phycisphaerae bacterium]